MTTFRDRLADELARAHYGPAPRRRRHRVAPALAVAMAAATAVVLGTTGGGQDPEIRRDAPPRVTITVAPSAATVHSPLRVRFEAPPPGAIDDRYWVRAEYDGQAAGCVPEGDDVAVDRGNRWTATLDPRNGEGGNLGWCPGRFHGVLERVDDATGRRDVVGRFAFSVAPPPGENLLLQAGCPVGRPPDYFFPHREDDPVLTLGCVRLATSGKPVDFLGANTRIGGRRGPCVGPTYTGGGRRGAAARTICRIPGLGDFRVIDREVPGTRTVDYGYGYVVWGTTGGADAVTATWSGGTMDAAVIDVPAARAERFGATPLRVFVLELPRAARCEQVTVSAGAATRTVRGKACA